MTNRREFIRNSAGLVAGTVFTASIPSLFMPVYPPPGIQLFTFFNTMDSDVEGTLKRIAGIGYVEIESAFSHKSGFYGYSAPQFAELLKGLGLKWKSHHVLGAPYVPPPGTKMPVGADGKPFKMPPMKTLRDNAQEIIDDVKQGGVEYLVCANIPTGTMEEVKSSIVILNNTNEACKKAGLKFAYHNHDAVFHELDGKIPYHMFLTETEVLMELDLAWAIKAGKDPVEIFDKHPGRFPLWHVKDMDSAHEQTLPLGQGTIDYKRIFSASEKAGLKYYFVEDEMPKDPWGSIQASYQYLKQIAPFA